MDVARHPPSLPLLSSPRSHLNPALLSVLRTPLSSRGPEEQQLLLDLLASLPCFQSFARSSAMLTSCAARLRLENIRKSEFIFHSGEVIAKCYIVLKGTIRLVEANESVAVGGCLGGQGLLGSALWPDTAVTEEDCELAVLQKKDIEEAVGTRKVADLVEILRPIPAFNCLRSRTLRALASALTTRQYRRGQYLFRWGDISDEIYIITEGTFSLSQPFSPPPALPTPSFTKVLRRRTEVAIVGAGTCLGCTETLEGRRRLQSCGCKSELGTVLVLGKRVRSLSELLEGDTERKQFRGPIQAERAKECAYQAACRCFSESREKACSSRAGRRHIALHFPSSTPQPRHDLTIQSLVPCKSPSLSLKRRSEYSPFPGFTTPSSHPDTSSRESPLLGRLLGDGGKLRFSWVERQGDEAKQHAIHQFRPMRASKVKSAEKCLVRG